MRWSCLLFATSLALAACAGGDREGERATDDGELRRARPTQLQTTSAVASQADPALLAVVRNIEASGGTGGWFRSVLPAEGAQADYYYLLRSVPARVSSQAPMLLLRLEHSRAALDTAVKGGTPVVIGKMPPQIQAAAAAFSDLPIATDAIAASGIEGTTSIVFLPPDTLMTTFAHELQHWKDYEDAAFQRRFDALAKPLMDASYLTDDDKADLDQIVVELRGHGMGERQALDDLAKGHPMLLRGGVPVSPAELQSAYEADAANQVNVFLNVYRPALRAIERKVKTAGEHEKLVALFDAMNLAPRTSRLFGLVARP